MQLIHNKIEAAVRYFFVYNLASYLPLYIVNEYPKSGGTWLGQMLAAALELPFPRNCIPRFESAIFHGHYLNPEKINNVVIIWRDPRDIMVSWYHHCLLQRVTCKYIEDINKHQANMPFNDYDNIKNNLPYFIKYCFENRQHGLKFSWKDFVNTWYPLTINKNSTIVTTFYEKIHQNTVDELRTIVYKIAKKELSIAKANSIVEQFSFKQQSGRKVGEENKQSFLRKGIVGDWKNYFSREACEVFNKFGGQELVLLGYEKNLNWIDEYSM